VNPNSNTMLDRMLELRASGESVSGTGESWSPLFRPGSVGSWPVVVPGSVVQSHRAKPFLGGLWLSLRDVRRGMAWASQVLEVRADENRRHASGSGSDTLAAHWAGRVA